ncbi:MAG TPA: hypothetical protein VJH55_01670 [Candidatus Paceibacterota bacterium]
MKKIIPGIIIVILLLTLSYGCFGTHAADAQVIGWFENKAIEGIGTWAGNTVLGLMSKAIFLTGMLLNASIAQTMNISGLVASIPSIELAWRTIRDVASMFFIFILLYAAICNILDVGHIKKNILPAIIIAGLLMNFSMFFTKVIIDASNVVSLGFYKAIIAPGIEAANNNKDTSTIKGSITALSLMDGGLSQIFMQALRIQTVFDPKTGEGGADLGGDQYNKLTPKNVIASTVMGSIVMLMAAFVFLAAACMFVVRTVVLVLLITLSPLAFLGNVLPQTGGFSSKWWSTLTDQAIFAPAYLMLTYIAMKVVTDPAFNRAINGNSADATFANAFMGAGHVGVILNYAIVIALLFATTIISKQFSGDAGKYGLKAAEMAKGWTTNKLKAAGAGAWKNTGGQIASRVASSEWLKDRAALNPILGGAALKAMRGVAGGYDERVKDKAKKQEQFAQSLGYDRPRVQAMEAQLRTMRQNQAAHRAAGNTALANIMNAPIATLERQMESTKRVRQDTYAQGITPYQTTTLWSSVGRGNQIASAKIEIESVKDQLRMETADLNDARSRVQNGNNTIRSTNDAITKLQNIISTQGGGATAVQATTLTNLQTRLAQEQTRLNTAQADEVTHLTNVNNYQQRVTQLENTAHPY